MGSANPETRTHKQNIDKVIKLERTLMDGSNFVLKGRPIDGETGSRLEIFFLHGWDAEDGISNFINISYIIFIFFSGRSHSESDFTQNIHECLFLPCKIHYYIYFFINLRNTSKMGHLQRVKFTKVVILRWKRNSF